MDMSKFEIVGHIYQTTDYDIFELIEGQRDPADKKSRIKKLEKSINERNALDPIKCNVLSKENGEEKFGIFDGGGRFTTKKKLGLPIEFIVDPEATIDDCIRMNVYQEGWKLSDYVHSFAKRGRQEYVYLDYLHKKFGNKLTLNSIVQIASFSFADSCPLEDVRNGTYKVMMKEDVEERLQFVSEMFDILGKGRGRARVWCATFKYLFYSNIINKDVLKKKLAAKIKTMGNDCSYEKVEQAINFIETIYNSKVRDESKIVDLMPDYRAVKKRFNPNAVA